MAIECSGREIVDGQRRFNQPTQLSVSQLNVVVHTDLALQCAHDPMEAPDRFTSMFDSAKCPNVVEYAFSSVIDEAVKNVTSALKTKGMWDNTLFVLYVSMCCT